MKIILELIVYLIAIKSVIKVNVFGIKRQINKNVNVMIIIMEINVKTGKE